MPPNTYTHVTSTWSCSLHKCGQVKSCLRKLCFPFRQFCHAILIGIRMTCKCLLSSCARLWCLPPLICRILATFGWMISFAILLKFGPQIQSWGRFCNFFCPLSWKLMPAFWKAHQYFLLPLPCIPTTKSICPELHSSGSSRHLNLQRSWWSDWWIPNQSAPHDNCFRSIQ